MCEHLRVDNFCLVKNKYIKTSETIKKRDCKGFVRKEFEESSWHYYLDQVHHPKKPELITITIKDEKD
ncbi:MAG: hypothetical protein GF308_03740 [Candidatus Heimdallarchaeota archaeon]|nr:hypothetical protein [Candidatus Heimdallarchaeota archaeon]